MNQTDLKSEFSKRLRLARTSVGISYYGMASRLSTTPIAYLAYEERRKLPSAHVVRKICVILNISADYLLALPEQEDNSDNVTTAA